MRLNVAKEVAALKRMGIGELRERYNELFGEMPRTKNKVWLVKRIAWRMQALAEGNLSERARQRAVELANDADLRLIPPRSPRTLPLPAGAGPTETGALRATGHDSRLPPPGTVLTRVYKGETLQVKVPREGFEFEGQVYPSLSAVAKVITGAHYNGFLFFGLNRKGGDR
jgi:hypothetical protein